jgi:hypothetical protein
MKKYFSLAFALVIIFTATFPASASVSATSEETFVLVDGEYFIYVTQDQFNEFNESTNLEEFIQKHSLERELPIIIENPTAAEVPSINVNRTRASVNLSSHELGQSGMYYYDSSGDPLLINTGGSFKISLNISRPQYVSTLLGYYKYETRKLYAPSVDGSSPSASFKMTSPSAIRGYAKPLAPVSYTISSGRMTWG